MMSNKNVRYFVFDIESVADADLISKVHFSGKVPPEEAVREYRDELLAEKNSDFIPYTFQIPISISIAKVADDFSLIDLLVLDEPEFRPHEITKLFWNGWKGYKKRGPLTLVTFNGRGFDLPLLELAAFRYGISVPEWFAVDRKSYEQPRNRFNIDYHFDIYDFITNFGANRFNGGLNLMATILGKPGKMEVTGNKVQDMYDMGELQKINDYCRCDVLDTYFTFLRTMLLRGDIPLEREQELLLESKAWLEKQSEQPAYSLYLEHWGDWKNPWPD